MTRRHSPQGLCLVSSGSRGNKLLFYDKGETSKDGESDLLSKLPASTLSEILAPNGLMVNHTFELNVDQWKFIGHPFSVQHQSFSVKFNIAFIVEACSMTSTVQAYDHLSHLLGSAIVHEEKKCGYLQTEIKTLLQSLEDMDIPDPSDEALLHRSSLAMSLHDVLCCLQKGECHLTVKINHWTEVSTLMQLHSEESVVKQPMTPVRSYSALILLDSLEHIIASIPSTCNPAIHRMLKTVSPMMNLQDVSLDADIPLSQVLQFASHLVHWGKAMTIYPLSESNVYIASSTAETRVRSPLAEKFSAELPELSLPQVLSNFEQPIRMSDISGCSKTIPMVVWLLQHRQIVQLHMYVYIVPSTPSLPSGDSTSLLFSGVHGLTSELSEHCTPDNHSEEEGLCESLLQHLSVQEYNCLMKTRAATDYEDLSLFTKVCKYFRGNQHLEEIMLKENIQRSQLLTLIDKFSEILVTCTLPEHCK